MSMFYEPENGHFHDRPIDGAVEISHEMHARLMGASARGNIIVPDSNGMPTEVAPAEPVLTYDQIRLMRLDAYRIESDPLKLEAEHDALVAGVEPDYAVWLAKVAEIKLRLPLPQA